jgi:2-polyprenyl-3-methyl-5-hydroxy-6-metoxy-1,4-benzoquinol methylase
MIERVSSNDIRKITAAAVAGMSDHDRDEMAIPSYLHPNPLIRWLMWRRYETIAAFLGDTKGQVALEFGCGMGLFLPELHRHFQRVFAIDLFPDYAVALSARRGLSTNFVAELDEIPDATIDVIIAADVLEHIEGLPAYLAKFSARLNKGGRLIVSGPTESMIYKLGRVVAGFGDKGDYHHTNIDRLIDDITSHGFDHLRAVRLPFPVPPTLFKVCEFRKAT